MGSIQKLVLCFLILACLRPSASSHPFSLNFLSGTHQAIQQHFQYKPDIDGHAGYSTIRSIKKYAHGGNSGNGQGGGTATTTPENGGSTSGSTTAGGAAVVPVITGGSAVNKNHNKHGHHNGCTSSRSFLKTHMLILSTLASLTVHLYTILGN